jgi:hypothetical protein
LDSSLKYLGPLFFAEIFIAAGGEVSDASVQFPPSVGIRQDLNYRYSESEEIGDVMYLSGNAESDAARETSFPSGPFEFTFSTPGGDVRDSVVSFAGAAFPTQPIIIFEQSDATVPFDTVDPSQTDSMYVEHAMLPHTQSDYGMPAFATFAAAT